MIRTTLIGFICLLKANYTIGFIDLNDNDLQEVVEITAIYRKKHKENNVNLMKIKKLYE